MDRLSDRRGDDAWLADARGRDDAEVLLVRGEHVARTQGRPPDTAILLGERNGRLLWAVDADGDGEPDAPWQPIRAALADDPATVMTAAGLVRWHARTRFCPACGDRLAPRHAGHTLACGACGTEQFPRIEPAIIVAVVDADDRLLLARSPTRPPGRVSTLAGFVEPGESLEEALRREVAEEVGVRVGDTRYVGSQPWPFPASLMLGFQARAETTELVLQEAEIAEAAWWARDELVAAMRAGRVRIPPPLSIAHRLVTDWLGHDDVALW